MRLLSSLIALVMLATACGSDGSVDLAAELAEAEQEIVALEEIRDELAAAKEEADELAAAKAASDKANRALESTITELEASLEEKETFIDLFDDEDGFLELLKDKQSTIDSLRDQLFVPLYSSGPCGVFRLSGTELLKLRWIDDHRDDVDPRDSIYIDGAVWWEKTGVDIGHEIGGYSLERRELSPHLQRDPDHVMAFKVAEDRNHFFHAEWFAAFSSDDYQGSRLDPERGGSGSQDMEGLLGASMVMNAAILGVDENCDWDIYFHAQNSSLTTERPAYGEDGDWARWFVEFSAKDYSCDGVPAPYSSTRYDAEADRFVTECPEPE